MFENDEIDPVIKAETVFIQECYPEEVKQADSLIGEWLKANGFTKQAEEYELIPFDIAGHFVMNIIGALICAITSQG